MSDEKKTESVSDIEKPKPSWIWMKDSTGYPSVTVTLVTVTFWTTILSYIASIFGHIGPVEFRAFDPASCSALLIPILGLYFGRRFVDARYGNPNIPSPDAPSDHQ